MIESPRDNPAPSQPHESKGPKSEQEKEGQKDTLRSDGTKQKIEKFLTTIQKSDLARQVRPLMNAWFEKHCAIIKDPEKRGMYLTEWKELLSESEPDLKEMMEMMMDLFDDAYPEKARTLKNQKDAFTPVAKEVLTDIAAELLSGKKNADDSETSSKSADKPSMSFVQAARLGLAFKRLFSDLKNQE